MVGRAKAEALAYLDAKTEMIQKLFHKSLEHFSFEL